MSILSKIVKKSESVIYFADRMSISSQMSLAQHRIGI